MSRVIININSHDSEVEINKGQPQPGYSRTCVKDAVESQFESLTHSLGEHDHNWAAIISAVYRVPFVEGVLHKLDKKLDGD